MAGKAHWAVGYKNKMILDRRYFGFFIIVITTFLIMVGCLSLSFTQAQDPKEKAFEVAHEACSFFRRMGIKQINNSEAVLETQGESVISKIWVVRLTGTWKSEWLITCEVSVIPDDWKVISTQTTRTRITP